MIDIESIMESRNVSRFHAAPYVSPQIISDHSWGVAMLCQYFEPDCSKALIMAALTHDCAELITGDIPASFKMDNPEIRPWIQDYEKKVERDMGTNIELEEHEKRLLKICDALEGMTYCVQRFHMGEIKAKIVFKRWQKHVRSEFEFTNKELRYLEKLEEEIQDENE